MKIADGQANDILAQVGALVKSDSGPLAGLAVRKMVLSGTSMSSGTLINYLPAHKVYRTPQMQHIYDGFLPDLHGRDDHGSGRAADRAADAARGGDERAAPPGQRRARQAIPALRVRRHRPRRLARQRAPAAESLHEAALHRARAGVLRRGIAPSVPLGEIRDAPPRAERVLLDRNVANDGSTMLLDEHGNAAGGIRTPYVDVPTAKYVAVNTAAEPLIANPSAYVKANGLMGAQIMCRLSAYQEPFPPAKLRELYGSKDNYVRMFTAALDELERQGWSLPVYRDMLLADAAAIKF